MKKLSFLLLVLFSAFACHAQAFNAKLKFGGKDGIDVISCSVSPKTDSDGEQTFNAPNGNKYILTIKGKKIIDHQVFNSRGKKITLSPVKKTSVTSSKTCQSCILITWPNRTTQQLCDNISCDDFTTLSKSVSKS